MTNSTARTRERSEEALAIFALSTIVFLGGACQFLAGTAVGGAAGYVVGHEAGEEEGEEDHGDPDKDD